VNLIDHKDSEMDTARKKTTRKKAAAKKSAGKKTAVKKTAARKTTSKKTPARKAAAKKAPVKKRTGGVVAKQAQADSASEKDLQALAMDIDRQMKILAEMNTRVIIAKDQLADFQEIISEKIKAFQARTDGEGLTGQKDVLATLRQKKDEAARMFKDSKALHETYENLAKHFEKGRLTAATEMKKAEAAFLEKFRVVEEKVLKKAGEIKKNLKN
jgi:hypothetical protein